MRLSSLSPEEYTNVFNEGKDAFYKDGIKALSPYFNFAGYDDMAEQTKSAAWENGWAAAALEQMKDC